ncbi:hypothetical protein [Neobacillus sp. LXY-4]|uniref:hypothetical protein n=1 Tax=Neobacillus sp. LXY-4 TaxID=3379826 RepID=UPI003EDFA74E
MHPIELIELIIAGGILLAILSVSFVLKGKWRKVIQGLAIVYLISFSIFYVVRPYWIDLQIENKVGYLQMYLEQEYPKETWEFWTVPHREDGYESMSPYSIGVIFDNEPEVEYTYFVRNKDDIIQTGYSSQNELQSDLLHLEDK